jgi:hypothetical protein
VKHFVFSFAVATLALACGGAAPPPSAPAQVDVAPYPYTVAEIRAGCPAGRVLEYRVEIAGAPPTVERWTFTPTVNDSVDIMTTTFDADGKQTGEPTTENDKWTALHEHARFPRDATTISSESITLPIGTLDVQRYDVKQKGADGAETVKTVWFARSLPGPPVKIEVTKAGKPAMTMTMQANRTH